MRLSLSILAATSAALIGGAALAQTAAPNVEPSGGATATAGTSAQSNRPTPSGGASADATGAAATETQRMHRNPMMSGPKTTPPASVERSGGPTATAGSSGQSNVNRGPAPNNPGQGAAQ